MIKELSGWTHPQRVNVQEFSRQKDSFIKTPLFNLEAEIVNNFVNLQAGNKLTN